MKKVLFNDNWTFVDNDGTFFDKLVSMDRSAPPVQVTLPHDAMIHSERKDAVRGVTVGFYQHNNYSYWKYFDLPKEDEGKVFWLEIEGIYHDAYLLVNDAVAGRCVYGYGNYYIEITDYLLFDKTNAIQIIVKNQEDSARWYSGGGIYRDIHLLTGDDLHIVCEGVKVTSKDVENDLSVLYVETPLEYVGSKVAFCEVVQEIRDLDGNIVLTDTMPATVRGHETYHVKQRLMLREPRLWDPDHPHLYTCVTKVYINGKLIDEDSTRFGVRHIQADPLHGFRMQMKTAAEYGIVGFAIYHYYSCGRKLLEKPTEKIRDDTSLPLPFFLYWANESWKKSWVGDDNRVVWAQEYGEKNLEAAFFVLPGLFQG